MSFSCRFCGIKILQREAPLHLKEKHPAECKRILEEIEKNNKEKTIRLGKKYRSHYEIVDNFKKCKVCKSEINSDDWDGGIDLFIECRKCKTVYKIIMSGFFLVKQK